MSNPTTLPKYEDAVRRLIIANYANLYFASMPPDEFVTTLHRIFRYKIKSFHNLALYVQKEVEEKGHPADKVLASLGFYAQIMREFVEKVHNQPLKK